MLSVFGGRVIAEDQQSVLRARWGGRDAAAANQPPAISIQQPSATGTHQTTATSIQVTGIVTDDRGSDSVVVTWACATCSPTSGTATVTGTTWDTGEAGMGTQVVVTDSFAEATTIDLTAHNAGYVWTTLVDSAGSRPNKVDAGTDTAKAFGTIDSAHTITLATPSPALSGATYIVQATAADTSNSSGNSLKGLIFGASDANNYCGMGWYGTAHSGGFDLIVFKREGGTASNLTTAEVNVIAGDVMSVTVNGTSITVKRGDPVTGTTVASTTSTFCDNATGVGLFFGNASGVSGDDQENSNRLDNFIVTDTGASGGIGLAVGANTITLTATDTGGLTATASIVVTRGGDTTNPVVTITSPTAQPTYATSTAAFSPAGDATDNVAISSMTCDCATCTPTSRTATVSAGAFSLASGFTLASGANTVSCTALDAAANSGSDSLVVTYTPADVTNPVVTITTDGGGGPGANFSTAITPTTLAGTCTDNVAPTQVTWANAQGAAGIATGTATWSASIGLVVGANNITVTCRDEAGNTHTDTITVTLTASTLTIVTTSMLSAVQNAAYSQPVIATGGTTPYTFDNNAGGSSLGGGACTGLSITTSGGQGLVSGTPTTTGACNFTARVTDAVPATDTQALTITVNAAASGNTYFNDLVARGDHWKNLSFRDTSHFLVKPTGFASTSNPLRPYDNAYDAGLDAGRFTILPFYCTYGDANWRLTANIGTTETSFTITGGAASAITANRDLQIGDEILDVVVGGLTPTVVRGAFGTTPAAHTTTDEVCFSNNSVRNPLQWFGSAGGTSIGTEDGFTYLFTWDTRFDTSYINSGLTNYKWFTWRHNGPGGKFFELNSEFTDQERGCWVAGSTLFAVLGRHYNQLNGPADWTQSSGDQSGPGITAQQPMTGFTPFCSVANRWIRLWVRIEQRANDYDYISMWAADESQAAVQIYNNAPLSISINGDGSLKEFDVEVGTSTEGHRRGLSANPLRNLVGYYRNLVVLRAAGLASAGSLSDANMAALLVQPE